MKGEIRIHKRPGSPRTASALAKMGRIAAADIVVPESNIEGTCSDLLALDGWRTLKTDPVSRKEWGKGFGELGMADRLYIRYQPGAKISLSLEDKDGFKFSTTARYGQLCELVWIEWKAKRGVLSPHQQTWHVSERVRGALTLIAGQDFPKSIKGFQAWYRASGLMRRKI